MCHGCLSLRMRFWIDFGFLEHLQPLEMVNDYFNEFLQRVGSSIPQGQRTPLLQSLGVPKPRGSRVNTPRRPLLDSSKAFDSSVIKYEVKLKKIFQAMQ